MILKIKEYAPMEIQCIRLIYKYKRSDFFDSLIPSKNEEKLKKLFDKVSSKGGNPIFCTTNRKFIVKDINKFERHALLKNFMLHYFNHICKMGHIFADF